MAPVSEGTVRPCCENIPRSEVGDGELFQWDLKGNSRGRGGDILNSWKNPLLCELQNTK